MIISILIFIILIIFTSLFHNCIELDCKDMCGREKVENAEKQTGNVIKRLGDLNDTRKIHSCIKPI